MEFSSEQVSDFWSWFATVAHALAADLDCPQIHAQLDREIAKLGEFNWELGPHQDDDAFLAISPAGNLSLLHLSDRIVESAPNLSGWSFFSSKPRREGALEFEMDLESGDMVEFDASKWRYFLYKAGGEIQEILIEQPEMASVSESDAGYGAAIVALDALLGERTRMCSLAEVSVVGEFTSPQSSKSTFFEHLRAHLASLGLLREVH